MVLSSLFFKEICLRVLKESNKRNFDSYSVRNSVLIISHITFRDCRMHIFPDNLSRNSCILVLNPFAEGQKLKKELLKINQFTPAKTFRSREISKVIILMRPKYAQILSQIYDVINRENVYAHASK